MPGYYGECVHTNAKRGPLVAHRAAITTADKLATPGTLTLTAVTEAGSTLANVAYNVAVAANNGLGPTPVGTPPAPITPTANQAARVAFAAVPGATAYDIFLSTDAAPLWVGRVTEAQRLAGDRIVSTVGAVTARAGSTVAGTVDVGIVGTGPASTSAAYAQNNAYAVANATTFSCDGLSRVHALVKLAVADFRTAPSLTLIPFTANGSSTGDWHMGAPIALAFLGGTGQALCQDIVLDVDGASGLVLLVDAIAGTTPQASIWLEGV